MNRVVLKVVKWDSLKKMFGGELKKQGGDQTWDLIFGGRSKVWFWCFVAFVICFRLVFFENSDATGSLGFFLSKKTEPFLLGFFVVKLPKRYHGLYVFWSPRPVFLSKHSETTMLYPKNPKTLEATPLVMCDIRMFFLVFFRLANFFSTTIQGQISSLSEITSSEDVASQDADSCAEFWY